jgi:hypothetical protein
VHQGVAREDDGLRFFECRLARFRHSRSNPCERDRVLQARGRTEVRPSSGSWAPGVDRTVEKISAWARWVVVKGKGKGNGKEVQLWFVSDGNGFQIVRFSDNFKAQYKELFEDSDD